MKITSIESAFKALKRKPVRPDYSMLPEKDQAYFNAHYDLTILIEAKNAGHTFDWDNWSETKHYPIFDMSSSGFGFSYSGSTYTIATVGSRLCLRNSEDVKEMATQFKELYRIFMLG